MVQVNLNNATSSVWQVSKIWPKEVRENPHINYNDYRAQKIVFIKWKVSANQNMYTLPYSAQ